MKLIGITTRIIKGDSGENIEKVPQSLLDKIKNNGGSAIIIPCINNDCLFEILKLCDGFIIPGGNAFHEVDEVVIKYAISNDLPLLGICAGMQAIGNLEYFVGSKESDKCYDLPNSLHMNKISEFVHQVKFSDGILKKIFATSELMVNSRHNQAIHPADVFTVEALSEDNVIEAIRVKNKKFIVGVQWHPEDMMTKESDMLFRYFISLL